MLLFNIMELFKASIFSSQTVKQNCLSARSLIPVRLFVCHNSGPSHALRKINSHGHLSGTVVRPLDLQSIQSILKQL